MKAKRIIVTILCILATLAIVGGEFWLIVQHENEHQKAVAGAVYDNVALNLDMIKIAVQTSDEELLERNVDDTRSRLKDLDKLFIAKKDDAEYINQINEYLDFVGTKKDLIHETKLVKIKVLEIKDTLKNSYNNATKVTQDEIKTVAEKIVSLKMNDEYKNESIKNVVTTTNSMLDEFATKANELAQCVNACYKNKITELTNGLNSIVKNYSEKVDELNKNIENEFNLDEINNIKFREVEE